VIGVHVRHHDQFDIRHRPPERSGYEFFYSFNIACRAAVEKQEAVFIFGEIQIADVSVYPVQCERFLLHAVIRPERAVPECHSMVEMLFT
jgi:hypothetical protein